MTNYTKLNNGGIPINNNCLKERSYRADARVYYKN